MPDVITDPFALTAEELQSLLATGAPLFPELEAARAYPEALRDTPQCKWVLDYTAPLAEGIEKIPQTSYTLYRRFRRDGDRGAYEAPYFLKRSRLAAAALRLFLGQTALKDTVQDYLWSICEETNWVLPAHEDGGAIDLFASETGSLVAETLALLGDTLDDEVRARAAAEIERRILTPYLRDYTRFWWYQGSNNWNGVCNGAVASTFLMQERDPARAARALALALAGIKTFLRVAFEEDGASTEGVSYWQYGLLHVTLLAEMLRARSGGKLDLLAGERMRRIAAYPAKMQLHGEQFASFSDCGASVAFNPGVIERLAERTSEASLSGLLARRIAIGSDWRLQTMLRNIFWWRDSQDEAPQLSDAYLPSGGTARLVSRTAKGLPVALALKAGHNAENHNQNDVGSFVLNVDGESLLTDPGPGLYCRDYFSAHRYENPFASSYGHSVPRIGDVLQRDGREYAGTVEAVETNGPRKSARIRFERAYPVPGLVEAVRQWELADGGAESGVLRLEDTFRFEGTPVPVEEALITWNEVTVAGATARIQGRHTLCLTIEEPAGAEFALEALEEASRANAKPKVLKRLSFVLPVGSSVRARVRVAVEE